jgi:transposase
MDKSTTARRRRSQRDYTLGFKLSVVEQVEKGDLTYKQAQRRYGIQGRSTVLVWLRKHGSLDWSPEHFRAMSTETPEQKIKRLEKELEDERTRNLILKEMMADIDRQYGVGLRKKYFSRLPEGCKPKAK